MMVGNMARSWLLVVSVVKSRGASHVCQSLLPLSSAVPGMAEVEPRGLGSASVMRRGGLGLGMRLDHAAAPRRQRRCIGRLAYLACQAGVHEVVRRDAAAAELVGWDLVDDSLDALG